MGGGWFRGVGSVPALSVGIILLLAVALNTAIAQDDAPPDAIVTEDQEAAVPDETAAPTAADDLAQEPTPTIAPADPGVSPSVPSAPSTPTPAPAVLPPPASEAPVVAVPTATPTQTASPIPAAPLPGGTGAGSVSCNALAVTTAQNNYMTGDYISWQATGFAPTSFVRHNVRQAPWRGEAAESPSIASLGIGTSTVGPQCTAGTGSGDAWLIPSSQPAGRYVVVVTGFKASDPTSLISLASPEFTIGPRTQQGSNPGGIDRPCYTGPFATPQCTPTPRVN